MRCKRVLPAVVLLILFSMCLSGCNSKAKELEELQAKIYDRFDKYGYECSNFSVANAKESITFYTLTASREDSSTMDYKQIYECLQSARSVQSKNYTILLRYVEIDGVKYALSFDEWSLIEYRKDEPLYNKIADTPFDKMTNAMKRAICSEIERKYDYYDNREGKYTGDKYSDIIWEEIQNKYNLTHTEVSIIWGHAYEY